MRSIISKIFYAPRVPPRRRSRKFSRTFSRKFVKKSYFANFLDAPDARGHRELPVVKISALNDPWLYQKRQKNGKNKINFFTISELSFSSFLIDFEGARLLLMSKSSSLRFFALDGQIFRSVRRLELIFGLFTIRTSTCGEIWASKVGKGGKSGNFLGVGRNPQEMPIEAEGREDIDISSTRRWPEASADFCHSHVVRFKRLP